MNESTIKPQVWYGNTDEDTPLCDGEMRFVGVERTDDDEVALHATPGDEDVPDVSLYVTCGEALALAHLLIAAALADRS